MNYCIGLDIGGTKIKGLIVDSFGQIWKELTLPTHAQLGKDHVLSVCYDIIDSLLQAFYPIVGIGIATGGRVDVQTGQIVYATDNLPGWMGLQLKQIIEYKYKLPTFVDNDANLALLGEMWVGAAKEYSHIVMLTLGTGVGGANAFFGRIYQGKQFDGGEYGHVILHPNGVLCNCGKRGCVEQYISGNALKRDAERALKVSLTSGRELFDHYGVEHPLVKPVMDEFINNLYLTIQNIHNAINPEIILLGGGLIDSQEHWFDTLTTRFQHTYEQPLIVPAILGNQAGAVGAAKFVFNQISKD